MILSLNYQASLFIMIFLMGLVISFYYDIMRFFRKIIPHNKLAVQIEDAIYWLVMVYVMFSFFIQKSFGEIRFFSIFAVFMGMIIYFLALSPYFIKASEIPAEFLKKSFSKIFSFIKYIAVKFGSLSFKKKNVLHFRKKCARIKFNKK